MLFLVVSFVYLSEGVSTRDFTFIYYLSRRLGNVAFQSINSEVIPF